MYKMITDIQMLS